MVKLHDWRANNDENVDAKKTNKKKPLRKGERIPDDEEAEEQIEDAEREDPDYPEAEGEDVDEERPTPSKTISSTSLKAIPNNKEEIPDQIPQQKQSAGGRQQKFRDRDETGGVTSDYRAE